MPELKKLYEAVLTGDAKTAFAVTEEALAEKVDAQELVSGFMIPAMEEVGRRFEKGEYFIPELLISARAMKSSLDLLRPILAQRGAEPVGHVVIGTVQGDLHDIGKNLVGYILEGGGFEVTDLGVNVSPEAFVAAVREKKARVVGLSALLTTTMMAMKDVIEELQAAGVRHEVKVMVGGAPVTPKFAADIGADAYGETAVSAVDTANKLLVG